ncbi:MAG: lipoyl synthase [Candidatus Sericytochromatia bacterium]|nr:lipoyl synthase [Candidatus Tanganyikabacteria bacterium]
MNRTAKPLWLKVRPPAGERYATIKRRAGQLRLATVCEQARCPNIGECWGGGTATFMLMGEVCTRGCRFCHVKTGRPAPLDDLEPENVASLIAEMGLHYVVLTSVDRDDLPDGGARHFARTVIALKDRVPEILVEVLIPDFRGDVAALREIVASGADVVAHNVETTAALTLYVRDRRATYAQSLGVLYDLKALGARYTKTSLMLGLGEAEGDVLATLRDLRRVECDIVTFGQYLQPSPRHLPVEEYVTPERFESYRLAAEAMGFAFVASGPLVRSSYRAGELFVTGQIRGGASPMVALPVV